MTNKTINDWEKPIDNTKIKEKKDYDLNSIYRQAHSELSLQQSKRDQIITIYLALCSFLLPFALGEEIIGFQMKGLLFLVVGIVGILFSFITVRYREYKEAYWLCCQAITVLQSFKTEELDKSVIQRAFYHCLNKKGKDFLISRRGEKRLNKSLYVKKNLFSSETIHFIIIDLMCSFISALGAALIFLSLDVLGIIIGILLGAVIFSYLLSVYFKTCIKMYTVLEERRGDDEDRKNDAFNKVFSKAWFLHFYYDVNK